VHGARLAQLVERKALNLVVVGSSPTVGEINVLFGWLTFLSFFLSFILIKGSLVFHYNSIRKIENFGISSIQALSL
jgi:hypothetical protein